MWTNLKALAALALGVAVVVVPAPSWASPVIYTGADAGANSGDPRPNADAAADAFSQMSSSVGPVSVITFGRLAVGAFTSLEVAPGITITDPSAVADREPLITDQPLGTPDSLYGYDTTQGGSRFLALRGDDIVFTFDTPIQAFRAYFSGVQFDGETLTFSDGSTQVVPITNPGGSGGIAFVGFIDEGKAISSITVSTHGDVIGIDDVRFVSATVPEPASLALAGVGLLIVATARVVRRVGRGSAAGGPR